jgi:hypothetical protein
MKARSIQRTSGFIILAVGLIHLAVTFIDYDEVSLPALWFVGSGFALLLIGGLNLVVSTLEADRFTEMKPIRWLTVFSNLCGATLGFLYIILTGGSQPQGPILVLLFAIGIGSQLARRDGITSPENRT